MHRNGSHPCRLGIVGGGLITQLAHLPVLVGMREAYAVRALTDPSARVRDALSRRYGVATYASHAEMLAAGGLDAVLVCSPNETHAGVTLAALAAGLHVLVEKPLALDPADGEAIGAAARRAGRVVQVGYMKRHAPQLADFLQSLPTGSELLRVESTTVDPCIGVRFRPRDFVAADDVDDQVTEAARDALLDQAGRAVGATSEADARSYSDAFAGALIHDVNVARVALQRLELTPGRMVDAVRRTDATLASLLVELPGGARWSATWMLAPAAREFCERLSFYFDDRPRTLAFGVPYADVRATYEPQLRRFRRAIDASGGHGADADDATEDLRLVARAFRHALARTGARA